MSSPPPSPLDRPEDYHIEQFWLQLKQSMCNFYRDRPTIRRPIVEWSDRLNRLQGKRRYATIQKQIHQYIGLYAIDLMRTNDRYHAHILQTNIKRWNEVARVYTLQRDESEMMMVFDIYIRYYDRGDATFKERFQRHFDQVELCLIYREYSPLIQLALDYQYAGILEILQRKYNVVGWLEEEYEILFPAKEMSWKKRIEFVLSHPNYHPPTSP